MNRFYVGLNYLLSLWVVFIGVIFFSLHNASGYLFAVIALVTAGMLITRKMWTYFAAGVLGIACFQLSKIGFPFDYEPRVAMTAGALLVPFAIFLSVKLGCGDRQKSQQ